VLAETGHCEEGTREIKGAGSSNPFSIHFYRRYSKTPNGGYMVQEKRFLRNAKVKKGEPKEGLVETVTRTYNRRGRLIKQEIIHLDKGTTIKVFNPPGRVFGRKLKQGT
jgi:hypothetical protein